MVPSTGAQLRAYNELLRKLQKLIGSAAFTHERCAAPVTKKKARTWRAFVRLRPLERRPRVHPLTKGSARYDVIVQPPHVSDESQNAGVTNPVPEMTQTLDVHLFGKNAE
jgi:hypothetical protein